MLITNLEELIDQDTYILTYKIKAGSLEEAKKKIDNNIQKELTQNGTLWNLCHISSDASANMKIYVMGKHAISQLFSKEAEDISGNIAIISISSDGEDQAKINTKGPILRVVFDDIDIQAGATTAQQAITAQHAITKEQGKAIAEFVKQAVKNTEIYAIIFQCAAGVSRSAGAAAAFCQWSDLHDAATIFNHPGYIPNMAVFRSVYEALADKAVEHTYND